MPGPKFIPDSLANVKSTEELISYLQRQNLKLQQVIDSLAAQEQGILHAPPPRVRDGLLVVADGTDWNPGSGAGPYMYYKGAWHYMTAADMPPLPEPPPPPPSEDPTVPPPPPPDPVDPSIVSFLPSSTAADVGATVQFTVTIDLVQASPLVIPIANSIPQDVSAPTSVTIPAGDLSATFNAVALDPGGSVLTATLNGISHNATFIVNTPTTPPPPPEEPPPEEPPPPPEEPPTQDEPVRVFSWENSATEGGAWRVQARATTRAYLVPTARHLTRAVALRTESGDNNVSGSGASERCDLYPEWQTLVRPGDEQWWAHSLMFPRLGSDQFRFPLSSGFMVVYQWHAAAGGTQPTFAIIVTPGNRSLQLRVNGTGGEKARVFPFGSQEIQYNVWYDFIEHFVWHPTDGQALTECWLRIGTQQTGTKILTETGANMFSGDSGNYLKPSNYHTAFGDSCTVYHDRVIWGNTQASVEWFPLD